MVDYTKLRLFCYIRSIVVFQMKTKVSIKAAALFCCILMSVSCGRKGFDESGVVLSLGAVSDVHINTGVPRTSEKWESALKQLSAKASESDRDGLDGVLVAGDMIDYPNEAFLGEFKRVYESVLDPGKTPLVYTVGNHDVPKYRWDSTMVRDAKYIRNLLGDNYFLSDKYSDEDLECRDCVIGGYHVLAITPNGAGPVVYDPRALEWIDNRMKEITTNEPDKYVVVITHPMLYDTVYGSLLGEAEGIWKSSHPGYWATRELPEILSKYPQVVAFGGHLHFPLNDPRSVWQGTFTALGCGSVRYMALEAGNYEDMASQTTMKDRDEFSQGNLIQFDRKGNMRIFRMDFYNEAVIGEPLVMHRPAKNKKHLKEYSFVRRSAGNNPPLLSSMEVSGSPEGGFEVTFPAGTDDEFVHHYVVTLSKDRETVATKKILADFYKHPLPSMMKPSWTVSFGPEVIDSLWAGDYSVSLTAYDSWDAASNTLTKEVKPFIGRKVVVSRHNPVTFESSEKSPAQVGNGRFAFGADITGLQTFHAFNTMSDWGWHSMPLPEGVSVEDYKPVELDTWGKKIPYILNNPECPEISDWLRSNPHRINLGRIGFVLLKIDGKPAEEIDLKDTRQEIDLWTGIIDSRFVLDGTPVSVRTACHPEEDLISIHVESSLVEAKRLGIFVDLPYTDGKNHARPSVGDYSCPEKHKSGLSLEGQHRGTISHVMDDTEYSITLDWSGEADLSRISEDAHEYRLTPKGGDCLDVTVLFSPKLVPGLEDADLRSLSLPEGSSPGTREVEQASVEGWKHYWMNGAAVDLSGSSDPRWEELERRIVLSQYLMKVNETGIFPPQEAGLVNNGWYGRFHWEMIWWHGAHFLLWNRPECVEGYLSKYESFMKEAVSRASSEGRKGAKWPKCTGNFNREWPCEPHAMLCWQQPHPIWFAEQEYRMNPSKEVLDKWADIVINTADYMADYVFKDEENDRFVIGPPVIPVSENTKMMETMNPVFELGYWRFGLRVALDWAKRLGLPAKRVKAWKDVLENLSELPVEDGYYITHEKMQDMWNSYNFEHPALTGIYGWLPGDGVDIETFRRTFYRVLESWQMDRIWGWDYPMLAMAAARLGDPEKAVDLLCTTAHKFAFDEHGLADMYPYPYFPANGGLLTAVAMMCAGWDGLPGGVSGSSGEAPGFPKDGSWSVRYEGFNPMM